MMCVRAVVGNRARHPENSRGIKYNRRDAKQSGCFCACTGHQCLPTRRDAASSVPTLRGRRRAVSTRFSLIFAGNCKEGREREREERRHRQITLGDFKISTQSFWITTYGITFCSFEQKPMVSLANLVGTRLILKLLAEILLDYKYVLLR